MLVTDKPVTLDDAEILGWTDLEIRCCRKIVVYALAKLRRKTRLKKLADIKAVLRCENCGGKPASVALHKTTCPVPRGSPESVTEAI